jgi:hypothetical protein
MPKRQVTLRRLLEQTKHCVEEALSIVEQGEDVECAIDDIEQAQELIEKEVLPALRKSGRLDLESP